MRRRRWLRRLAIAMAALVVLAGAGWWLVWRPVAPAARFFTRLTGANPTEAEFTAAGGAEVFENGKREDRLLPYCRVIEGPTNDAPLVIAVAGVTPKGIDDPRVLRLLLALHDAGVAVVAPQVDGLARPGEDDELVDAVARVWSETLHGGLGSVRPPPRVAFLGVSLGGGLVLRALARGDARDPDPKTVSAVFLVGSADDPNALAPQWFRRRACDAGAGAAERQCASDGRFARHGILRGAIPELVKDEGERSALRAWIDPIGEEISTDVAAPTGLSSPEALRWLAAARAEADISDVDLAWTLAAARSFLDATSPAAIPAARLSRVSMPVFLIHGEHDPLVPVSELEKLSARLLKVTSVRTLPSALLAHVEVESPGLVETWRHLRFVQDFFDATQTTH